MKIDEALDILDAMFNPLGIPWRRRKNELLYTYASRVKAGCIVELGTDEGMGAIALALGSKGAHVYTVDPYTTCRSSALGASWGPEKEAIFHKNVERMGLADRITQVKLTAQEAARTWEKPVGFLFWDATVDGENIADDLELWDAHVLTGAYFMARDKDNGVFGSWEAITRFCRESDRYILTSSERFTTILRKEKCSGVKSASS